MPEEFKPQVENCHKVVGYQAAEVCAPITVEPTVRVVSTKTRCTGKPSVRPAIETCDGKCKFKIKQNICVEVCVEFGAGVFMDAPIIDCKSPSDKNICDRHVNEATLEF